MWHPIRPRMCSNFKILVLVLLSRATHNFKQSKCYELSEETGCECNYEWGFSHIVCPTVRIEIGKEINNMDYVNIKCEQRGKIEFNSLPKINIGKRNMVGIGNCELSDEPIAFLLDQLDIKNIKYLYIENATLGYNFTRLLTGLSELEELFLFLKNLTLLPADFFVDLSNVTTLLIREGLIELPQHIFDPLQELTKLDLSYNNLNQLPEGIFRNQYKLKQLDLFGNRLRNLTKRAFQGATSLKILNLENNDIDGFEPDIFSLLPALSEIYLNGNELHKLPPQLFANNKNLTILQIYQDINDLEFQPSVLFANVSDLQEMYISCDNDIRIEYLFQKFRGRRLIYKNCCLRDIPYALFTNSRNWASVSLPHNNLRLLPDSIFSDQSNMKLLDLSHNKLKSLQHGLFGNTSSFILLDLTYNKLIELSGGSFLSLSSLELLCLDNNKLRLLPDGLFNKTTKLVVLKLSYNQLIEISAEIFTSLVKLEELHLDNNNLHLLPDGLFNRTTKLVQLKLSYNQLTNLSAKIFSPLVKLEMLFLDNNNLMTISAFPFNKYENNLTTFSAFFLLEKMQTLNLRNNSIQHIYWDWMNALYNLKELDLSSNNITTLDYTDLAFQQNAILVNLSYNQLRTINYENVNPLAETSYKSIDLNFNTLECDCKIIHFWRYLRGVSQLKINFAIDNLLCAKPADIKFKPIREIKPEELLCSIKRCPLGCNCWERTYDDTLLVNCSNANLTVMPTLATVQTIALGCIELYVENNQLLNISRMSLSEYAAVKKIYAAGNNISQVDVNDLPTELTYLDLSRNNLKRLGSDVINHFNQNQSLTLAGNPWDCDCDSRTLFLFAERRSIISDYKKMFCATPENSIMHHYFIDYDLCPETPSVFRGEKDDHRLTFTLTVSCLSVCLLIAIMIIACYKYETEVKIWIYSHPWLRGIVSESDVDDEKIYDAFVSYSHKDREFIGTTLVPELERDGPIHYKLCIHVRDFIVGDYITDQIIRAIDESRRTIIVLSKHFIQSAWACFEFRLAHQAAVKEGRSRVIVIMYEDVGDIDLLEPVLRAYLRTNTYLEWGDPRFWDRLRYAMPHPVHAPPNETSQATTSV